MLKLKLLKTYLKVIRWAEEKSTDLTVYLIDKRVKARNYLQAEVNLTEELLNTNLEIVKVNLDKIHQESVKAAYRARRRKQDKINVIKETI